MIFNLIIFLIIISLSLLFWVIFLPYSIHQHNKKLRLIRNLEHLELTLRKYQIFANGFEMWLTSLDKKELKIICNRIQIQELPNHKYAICLDLEYKKIYLGVDFFGTISMPRKRTQNNNYMDTLSMKFKTSLSQATIRKEYIISYIKNLK